MSGNPADPLDDLRERVAALDAEPLDAHPGALDDVHRALVSELDGLAGTVTGTPTG